MANLTNLRLPRSIRLKRISDGQYLRTLFPVGFTDQIGMAVVYADHVFFCEDARLSGLSDEQFKDMMEEPLQNGEDALRTRSDRPGYEK